jgi:ribosomal protein S18 acetylase RimI-like enzyme
MNNQDIQVQWITDFNAETSRSIVSLIDCATADGGTLGYVESMTDAEAESFVSVLSQGVAGGKAHVLLGHIGDIPAFLAVLTLNVMSNCKHRAELSKGIVHPSFRGKRLVELAFHELVKRAEVLGVDQLVLDVRESSRAHILWQRFGFVTYGVLEDYARVHGIPCRGHFMVQSVDSLRSHLGVNVSSSLKVKETINA